ncbi:MAG: 4-(cytidine 5'-diphospho)-2-C-methyl-D-erythritol kinase [Bacteroidales bacterium]
MIVYPRAKVNIGLRIIGKRKDGFHDLETFFISAGTSDVLEVTESTDLKINLFGLALDSDPMQNLCIKAYSAMREEFDIPPVEINLFKRIPFGAGLGGGSSDASGTIIAINKLYGLNLSSVKLAEIASRVGSDCPFFIYADELNPLLGEGMIGRGKGDVLSSFGIPSLASYNIEIQVPDVHVPTPEAYRGITPSGVVEPLEKLLQLPVETWKDSVINDFEKSIFIKYPEIEQLKRDMYKRGAVYASMSGSGSAVFGLFSR